MSNLSTTYSALLAQSHDGSPYYEQAEASIGVFWDSGSPFLDLFQQLDLTFCTELACGHGRHSQQISNRANRILLVDVLESNIEYCKQRFSGQDHIGYYVTKGNELSGIADASVTSVFSYDAMVHFESIDLIAYLQEIHRILVPKGKTLLHFSNFDDFPEKTYHENPHWRNFFSAKMMIHFATRFGFRVIETRTFSWPPSAGGTHLDAVVLLEKPSIL
jgi:ubiquinone/menaquinone biosynthesis C-methylase UbiE